MIKVIGAIDNHTRCKHYHSVNDVIGMKLKCCEDYYGCYFCHEEAADHAPKVWPRAEWKAKAVLCGGCGSELTIDEYLKCDYHCPVCSIAFNPGCKNHYHFYFE